MRASRGKVAANSSQPAVRGCTALSSGSAYLRPVALVSRRSCPEPGYRSGLKSFRVLQWDGKGLEFNNLARGFASFCQFESSKVEWKSLKDKS